MNKIIIDALADMKAAYEEYNRCLNINKYINSKTHELNNSILELNKKVAQLEERKHETLGLYGIGEASEDRLKQVNLDLINAKTELELQKDMEAAIRSQKQNNDRKLYDVKNDVAEKRSRYAEIIGDNFESQVNSMKKLRELVVSVYVANRFANDPKIGSMCHVDWGTVLLNTFPMPSDEEIGTVVDKIESEYFGEALTS